MWPPSFFFSLPSPCELRVVSLVLPNYCLCSLTLCLSLHISAFNCSSHFDSFVLFFPLPLHCAQQYDKVHPTPAPSGAWSVCPPSPPSPPTSLLLIKHANEWKALFLLVSLYFSSCFIFLPRTHTATEYSVSLSPLLCLVCVSPGLTQAIN